MKKLLYLIILILLIGLSCTHFQENEYDIIKSSWTVERIISKDKDITNQFRKLTFTLLDDDKLISPKKLDFKFPYPLEFDVWRYIKKDESEGVLVIEDKLQNFFSGNYEIKVIEGGKPKKVLLQSDFMDIYLVDRVFSIRELSIPQNYNPSR